MLSDRRELSTAKQAHSAAHQYGCPGVTNWDFGFRDVKDVVSTAKTKKFVINHFNPAKIEGVRAFQECAPWESKIAYNGYVIEM